MTLHKISTTRKKFSSVAKKSFKNKHNVQSGKSVSSKTNDIHEIIPHKLYTTTLTQDEISKLNNIVDKHFQGKKPAKSDRLNYYSMSKKDNLDDRQFIKDIASRLLAKSGLWTTKNGFIELFKYEMKGGSKESIFMKHRDKDGTRETVNSCVIYTYRDTGIQNCNMNHFTIDTQQNKLRKVLAPKYITHTIPASTGTAILMKGNLLHQQEVCKGNGIANVIVVRLYDV